MTERRTKILILLCGALILTATTLSHAQEPGKLLDEKTVRAEVSPVFVPDIKNIPALKPAEVKPDKAVSENPWYWRILQGILLGAAQYNTDKQSDGRPEPHGNFR